jgi:hypothetical protein
MHVYLVLVNYIWWHGMVSISLLQLILHLSLLVRHAARPHFDGAIRSFADPAVGVVI